MKTQKEYAYKIGEIVLRDVESCQSDWFLIDQEIFMLPENRNKAFILGTRKTGCDLIILGGTNCDEGSMDWLFGSLGNENFYVCQPLSFQKSSQEIEKVNPLYAFKVGSKYLNRSYERLNVINEGVVPAVEGCVGYTNEEFERVNKENNDPESAKIGSFNKTVEEANNIRSRVLKYVDKIKQERAYNIDLCMTFERYIEIADKDAERAMAFLKEAYPFNEETEVFIRKRYNMSIDVNPE